MPIPYRDQDELDQWGAAAFLRVVADLPPPPPSLRGKGESAVAEGRFSYRDAHDSREVERAAPPFPRRGEAEYFEPRRGPGGLGYRGALFQINARGEPLEFTYNRVDTPNTFLWRPDDLRRAALKQLVGSLLAVCPRVPRLLLCLASEVPSELFCQDLRLALPVGRVATALETASYSALEPAERLQPPPGAAEGSAVGPLTVYWFPAPPDDGAPERVLLRHLQTHGLLLEPFDRAALGLEQVYGRQDAPPAPAPAP